jgi:hypothetical protein
MPGKQKRSGKDAAADRFLHRVLLSIDYYFNIKTIPKRYEYEGKALQPWPHCPTRLPYVQSPAAALVATVQVHFSPPCSRSNSASATA